jgi:serine/threonine protein kinase
MALEGTHLGKYCLHRLLGRGGMGEVYLAQDPHLKRQVALKVVCLESLCDSDGSGKRLFQREMQAIAALNHQAILPLYDYGEASIAHQTLLYLVMPYYEGGSLADWLRRYRAGKALPLRKLCIKP